MSRKPSFRAQRRISVVSRKFLRANEILRCAQNDGLSHLSPKCDFAILLQTIGIVMQHECLAGGLARRVLGAAPHAASKLAG